MMGVRTIGFNTSLSLPDLGLNVFVSSLNLGFNVYLGLFALHPILIDVASVWGQIVAGHPEGPSLHHNLKTNVERK
jgi:hypothetical protein